MHLETARLRLYPLSREQLLTAHFRLGAVLKPLDVETEPVSLVDWWQRYRIYSAKAHIMELYPKAWLLSTSWLIVEMSERLVVGDAGFKGPPTADHAVELGYSTRKGHRGKGVMTEAVTALTAFALSQKEYRVEKVTALTKYGNYASHRVLEKSGFVYKPEQHSRYMYWERGSV